MILQPSSKKRFCRESTNVLKWVLGIMTPNDDTDCVWQANIENSKQISLPNDKLDKNFGLILNSLAEAYNNADHWTVHCKKKRNFTKPKKDLHLGTR